MERYSVITNKNPREIVLLRGSGCKWRRCAFCDYHLDFSPEILPEKLLLKISKKPHSPAKILFIF